MVAAMTLCSFKGPLFSSAQRLICQTGFLSHRGDSSLQYSHIKIVNRRQHKQGTLIEQSDIVCKHHLTSDDLLCISGEDS